jgi:hypothetical protein
MVLEYSCFISYRRYDEELAKSFIENLKHALQSELVFYFEDMHIFIDKEEIPGGVYSNTKIRNALCKSVCMILVYTPNYFSEKHLYCTQEFLLMKKIENKRNQMLRLKNNEVEESNIIPIILRAPQENHMHHLNHTRSTYDFSRYSLVKPNIVKNSKYVGQIQQIATYVDNIHKRLTKAPHDIQYTDIDFPDRNESLKWIRKLNKKDGSVDLRFPLREEF